MTLRLSRSSTDRADSITRYCAPTASLTGVRIAFSLGRQPTEQIRSRDRPSRFDHVIELEQVVEVSVVNRPSRFDHTLRGLELSRKAAAMSVSRSSTNRASMITRHSVRPATTAELVSVVNRPSKHDHTYCRAQVVDKHGSRSSTDRASTNSRFSICLGRQPTGQVRAFASSRRGGRGFRGLGRQPTEQVRSRQFAISPRERLSGLGRQPTDQPSKYDHGQLARYNADDVESRPSINRANTNPATARPALAVSAVNQPSKYDHRCHRTSGEAVGCLGRQPTKQVRSRRSVQDQ